MTTRNQLRRRIAELTEQNKKLREDTEIWKKLSQGFEADCAQLREDNQALQELRIVIHRLSRPLKHGEAVTFFGHRLDEIQKLLQKEEEHDKTAAS